MKLTTILLMFGIFQVQAKETSGQTINLDVKKTEIRKVLNLIERTTPYRFLYNYDLPGLKTKIDFTAENMSLEEAMDKLLPGNGLTFKTINPNLIAILSVNEEENIEKRITGKITGENNEPLSGVSVAEKGTSKGTTTDNNGNFSLTVSDNAVLVITNIGYETVEIATTDRIVIDVKLVVSVKQIEQVVVIGYGTQRKRDLTGSIARIKGEDIAKQPIPNAAQAMQGKVAGVQVIASGQPNSSPQVRIRGTGSALAGVNPLYVVDGILTDDIRNINSNDIVSMEVLKDASASIYGVRAANGVIIITTRKGKPGETKVKYDGYAGYREATNLVEMANRDQYVSYLSVIAPTVNVNNPPLTSTETTNWYDDVLRNAFQMNHNISVSGGSDKATFFVSGGFIQEDGIVQTNDFERYTFRANTDINISKKFKLGTQLAYSRGNEKAVELGDTYRNVYRAAPIVPSKIGTKYGNTSAFGNVGNALLSMNTRDQRIINDRFLGTVFLEFNPVKWLKFRSAFNADKSFSNDRTYLYAFQTDTATYLTTGGNQRRINSQLSVTESKFTRWVFDNTATFDKTFDKHSINFLLGSVTEKFNSNFISGSRINVPAIPDQWYLNLGNPDVQSSNNSGGDEQARQSFVTRLNYGFDKKYLLTASLRADGSSKFSEQWGYFPTIGLAWVISDENFMTNIEFLDYLKIRGNWGRVGNDNIESAAYILTASVNIPYFYNNAISLGTVIQDIKDEDLQWEISEQINIGFEFGALKNRLTGEVDFYDKKTVDALAFKIIPAIFGDPDNQYLTNVASFTNRGVEISLNWADKTSKDFGYSFGGNISFNKNRLLGLNGGQALLAGGVGQQGLVTRTDNGHEVGSFYVLKAIGVFQTQAEIDASPVYGVRANVRPGDLKYEDQNKDGIIDLNNDKVYAGSYQPKLFYGLNLGLTYKGFDMSTDFYGNSGNKIYNGKRAFRFENTDNIEAEYADGRWTPTNASNKHPRIINSATPPSTYFIESGNFIRMNNLTIGYTLARSTVQKIRVENIRIYFTAQNLFTAKEFSGFSPELPGGPLDSGIELNTYPTTRTFAFGLNLGF